MLKKHYELRYNPDIEGKAGAAVLYLDESLQDYFRSLGRIVEFGSIGEADMYLAASGFEKDEAKRVPPFCCEGVEYKNVLMWEVTPCS